MLPCTRHRPPHVARVIPSDYGQCLELSPFVSAPEIVRIRASRLAGTLPTRAYPRGRRSAGGADVHLWVPEEQEGRGMVAGKTVRRRYEDSLTLCRVRARWGVTATDHSPIHMRECAAYLIRRGSCAMRERY